MRQLNKRTDPRIKAEQFSSVEHFNKAPKDVGEASEFPKYMLQLKHWACLLAAKVLCQLRANP